MSVAETSVAEMSMTKMSEHHRYIERVFLSWCTNKLDIHGNFSELLDLLIDQRAHDCYGLVYFSYLPVKPRQ